MASSNRLDTTTLVLVLLGALVALPLLTMGLGFGGMMGGYGGMMGGYGGMMGGYGTGGWWPLVGMLFQFAFLLVLVGGGYLLVRRVSESRDAEDPAMAQLRLAYARGEVSDDEFETRRERLERSE